MFSSILQTNAAVSPLRHALCLALFNTISLHYKINNDYRLCYICSGWFLDIRISTCLIPIQHKLQASYVSYFHSIALTSMQRLRRHRRKNDDFHKMSWLKTKGDYLFHNMLLVHVLGH